MNYQHKNLDSFEASILSTQEQALSIESKPEKNEVQQQHTFRPTNTLNNSSTNLNSLDLKEQVQTVNANIKIS